MHSFAKHAILMFVALRVGDIVNLAAGLWFVPRYISPNDIGALMPVASFATFLSLPAFALAMAVMKESSALHADGDERKIRSLLKGVFIAAGAMLSLILAGAIFAMPRFMRCMRVESPSAAFLAIAAALLGTFAPVYTDALQSLKRFKTLSAIEIAGSFARFFTLLAVMPIRALAGYFAGQAALPFARIVASVAALAKFLKGETAPYWQKKTLRHLAASSLAILAYLAAPMLASMLEQSILRTKLPDTDSAAYYMITRFPDFLNYFTYPLLLVMFPYTAASARRNESTRPYVIKCMAACLVTALAMSVLYACCGEELLALLPNGERYSGSARLMPLLTLSTALTSCQVFHTNAEVSAGRFSFLKWFIPYHLAYALILCILPVTGAQISLDSLATLFTLASTGRFLLAFIDSNRPHRVGGGMLPV